jgi:NAD(P)-dependent dehydrogenase (short-subunit alcohol dehydrogenase family)
MPDDRKVVIVTGASSGIGRACAVFLAARGMWVFGTSRRGVAPPAHGVEMVRMDVDRDDSVELAVQRVLELSGRIDGVVNNAGIALAGAVEDTGIEEAKAVLETNLFGAWRVCRAVLPVMRAQGGGHIVNISSLGGILGIPYQGAYSASKFALEGMSESLSAEVRRFGISVVLIEPGDLPTALTDRRTRTAAAQGESVYHDDMTTAVGVMEAAERAGPDPLLVAKVVHRVLSTSSPRLRYAVGRPSQRLAVLWKRVLPDRLFERQLMREFRMQNRLPRD